MSLSGTVGSVQDNKRGEVCVMSDENGNDAETLRPLTVDGLTFFDVRNTARSDAPTLCFTVCNS